MIEKWNPKGGKFSIHGNGTVSRDNYKQAEQAAKKMCTLNRLLAYVDEFETDFEFGKYDCSYYVYFDHFAKEYRFDLNNYHEHLGCVYMSIEVAEELCRKLNSGEVVL